MGSSCWGGDRKFEHPLPVETTPQDLYDKCHGRFSWLDGESGSFAMLQRYLDSPEAAEELNAFHKPLRDGVLRVVIVRHGFGEHNKWHSVGSLANRDAKLDDIGIIEKLDLAVISPFSRTLETAQHLLAGSIGVNEEILLRLPHYESRKLHTSKQLETYIQPLCAEDTMSRAAVLQGNLGSLTSELSHEYPMFDFSPVDEYCKQDGTNEWWRHHNGPNAFETSKSFEQRATIFRQWLAKLPLTRGTRRAIIISHGGFLKECFGYDQAPNCGFRVYDVLPDSTVVRCNKVG